LRNKRKKEEEEEERKEEERKIKQRVFMKKEVHILCKI